MDNVRVPYVVSSFCGPGACVAVAALVDGPIAVRDNKVEDGPILTFTVEEWDAFVAGVKSGEFDSAHLLGKMQRV